MKIADLDFDFPEELIAQTPRYPSRVLLVQDEPQEIPWAKVSDLFQKDDILIVNNTKVMPRRIFAGDIEILFLNSPDQRTWEVLFPSKKFKVGDEIEIPGRVRMKLLQKGRPQKVETSEALNSFYFEKYGELPLPPYIQKMRGERHIKTEDKTWYQTEWAKFSGSFAAPTASLHFKKADMEELKQKGVRIFEITLHVGLGTFLPVEVDDLNDHVMHFEEIEVPKTVWSAIQNKPQGARVWGMGTTVARALESVASGKVQEHEDSFRGATDLLIQPGYQFQVVDRLLTNFHLPKSTLLALVYAFKGQEKMQKAYAYAIANKFHFFSYGDLCIL